MIVSFSSFSLLATPVEMAASFARKKKDKKQKKQKKRKRKPWGWFLAQVKIYWNTVHNKPQPSQTQFIRMGDYKLSICEMTAYNSWLEEFLGLKWHNNQFLV